MYFKNLEVLNNFKNKSFSFNKMKKLFILFFITLITSTASYAEDQKQNDTKPKSTPALEAKATSTPTTADSKNKDSNNKDSNNKNENSSNNLNAAANQNNQSQAEKEKIAQLQNYQGLTNWLITNKKDFQEVIDQTAKDTKTKWFIEQDLETLAKEKETLQKTNDLENKKPATIIAPAEQESKMILHTVEKGDTLYSISKKYLVTKENILFWNNLNNESILIGQKLTIYPNLEFASQKKPENLPAAANNVTTTAENKANQAEQKIEDTATNKLPEYKYYKVQKGDTINSIANNNNMTAAELITLNSLNPKDPLTVDVILKVKGNYDNLSNVDKKLIQDGFLWPVVGRLSIPFGPQSEGTVNEGINILAKKGTPIKATQDGIITYVGDSLKNFGNIILIQHTDHWVSAYAHVDNIMVQKGQEVKKGDIIARVSDSGSVKEPQLHFELRNNIKPMDPLRYLQSYR